MSRVIPLIDGLPKLNPERKAEWVAALRSGDYFQGIGSLRTVGLSNDHMCCLGVLCDLHSKTPVGFEWKKGRDVYEYDFLKSYPPNDVLMWAGLEEEHLRTTLTAQEEFDRKLNLAPMNTGMVGHALAALNDNLHFTFAEIAEFVDKNM